MQISRVLTLTLNPAVDMRMRFHEPQLGVLNRASSVEFEPSGKGINVARALQRQSVPVRAIAPLGGVFGQMLEQQLRPSGLDLLKVPIAGETRCNVKVLDQNGNLTELNAPGPALDAELEAVRSALTDVQTGDAVVFSGKLPHQASSDLYAELMRLVQQRGAVCVLDADGEALRAGLEAKPALVKPNRFEAETLLGRRIASDQDALEAASAIQRLGARHVVLSLGADGAIFASPSEHHLLRPPALDLKSTVGCGDALLAGVLVGLFEGKTWWQTALHASATAAARAEHGTEFPSSFEVTKMLQRMA